MVDIRPGDVIIFRKPDSQDEEVDSHPLDDQLTPDELVHRVITICREGLITRGDNNLCTDAAPVTDKNLVGRVTHVERGKKLQIVRGGQAGLLHSQILIAGRLLWKCMTRFGREPYRWLCVSGVVARIWKPHISKVRLTDNSGLVIKFICYGRTVARYWPQQGHFECKKPYDLVLRGKNLTGKDLTH
jgi:hypothetical protein